MRSDLRPRQDSYPQSNFLNNYSGQSKAAIRALIQTNKPSILLTASAEAPLEVVEVAGGGGLEPTVPSAVAALDVE